MLIYQSFELMAQKQPEKVCLINGNSRCTYREFNGQMAYLAKRLAAQIQTGDRVLIRFADPVAQLLHFYAVVKAGGVGVLIDSTSPAALCAELIKRYTLQHHIQDGFQPAPAVDPTLPLIDRSAVFLGALSSGSLGTPKMIWRDHQSWTSAFAVQSRIFGIDGTDILYLAGNLSYTANLNACLHLLAEGGTVVFAGNPRTWFREMIAHHVSAVFMVPAHYRTLLQLMPEPVGSVRSLVTAGAKMDDGAVRALTGWFPAAQIVEYYGASELGHVSYATAADLLACPRSVGKAFPGVTITIEDGVIWVESPYLAPAYRPKATVNDLGKIDEKGNLILLGRRQGLINFGGVKVIPEQVEAVLLQCPGVAEAVVGGVEDPVRGQRVCAWIVRRDQGIKSGNIRAFCRSRLNRPFCPQIIVFVEAIPGLANGKVDRLKLKENYLRSPK